MKTPRAIAPAAALVVAAGLAAPVSAQTSPYSFGTVYNIASVPVLPGDFFYRPDAIQGVSVGDNDTIAGEAFLAPGFLTGDILGTNSQLNVFFGGVVQQYFTFGGGPTVEVNIHGGYVSNNARAFSRFNLLSGGVGDWFTADSGSIVDIRFGTVGNNFRAESGSTVNISGGVIGNNFFANAGSTVNLTGGVVGAGFSANSGSTVNISGGSTSGFTAFSGSTVNLSSGFTGPGFTALLGSTVKIFGADFRLNNESVFDLPGGVGDGPGSQNDLFTGVLVDGRVFIFSAEQGDYFAPTSGDLRTVALPPSANPGVLSSGLLTQGLRSGETLTVNGTGQLGGNFAAVASTLNIEGGSVGNGLEVAFSEVNISNGVVGNGFTVFGGSTVNVTGGSVGASFTAKHGATVNISGGTVAGARAESGGTFNISGGVVNASAVGGTINITGGTISPFSNASAGGTLNISGGSVAQRLEAQSGGTINISGGAIRDNFWVRPGGTANISGGTIGRVFTAFEGSTVNLAGSEFRYNNAPITALPSGGSTIDVLSGVLADGQVFIFGRGFLDEDFFSSTTINVNAVATAPSVNPGVLSSGVFTKGLRPGESLTVNGSGALGANFAAVDATLNIEGGSVGNFLEVAFSEVNISGGTVGSGFAAYNGSTVNITGGSLAGLSFAGSSTAVNIAGGSVGGVYAGNLSTANITGGTFGAFEAAGSTVNISGGTFGNDFVASFSSTTNISGGTFAEDFAAFLSSRVNLFGTSFVLDGVEMTDLVLGEAFTVGVRDVTLSGVLADGSAFSFDLNSSSISGGDWFEFGATLTVTLVPTPGAAGVLAIGGLLAGRRRRA